MNQQYIIILTKNFHPLRLECGRIIYYNSDRAFEPRQDVSLQELDDDCVDSLICEDFLYPIREIASGNEFTFVLHAGWRIYFT